MRSNPIKNPSQVRFHFQQKVKNRFSVKKEKGLTESKEKGSKEIGKVFFPF